MAWYKSAVGALMWAAMHVRSDLAYVVGILNWFSKNYSPAHVELIEHVLQYLSGTLDLGLIFDRKVNTPDDIVGYIDSNLARQKQVKNQLETTFLCLENFPSVILQNSICLSHYQALRWSMLPYINPEETIWLGFFLAKLGFRKNSMPIILYADNPSSIALSNHTKFYCEPKHIDIQFYWICKVVYNKQLPIIYIFIANFAGNNPTKNFRASRFWEFWRMIGSKSGLKMWVLRWSLECLSELVEVGHISLVHITYLFSFVLNIDSLSCLIFL